MERVRPGIRKFCGRGLCLLVGLSFVLLTLVCSAETNWLNTPVARAHGDDAAYETEVKKATDLLRQRQYDDALKSFKRANEMQGKKSALCFFGMAQAYYGLEAYKNVVESCDKVIELAGNDTQLRAQAHNFKGIGLQKHSEGKDEKKLREAETVLRQGLALNADVPTLHFNLGFVLMQLNRDPEGISEMQKYLELQPSDEEAERARKMIENPRRAREAFAPDFSVTTAAGEHITLEDLKGKVVVLDFWGTWCPPCVASIPSLRSLHKRYAKEPSFILIGVSSDAEEGTWREFTTKNKMIWPQYWDRDRRVQRAFNVRAFPTYIVIDHEGIVRFRSIGTSWERSAYLDDAIKKQVKIVAKAEAAN